MQNRLIQTIQTGGQQYSDTSHFSIPWGSLYENEPSNPLFQYYSKRITKEFRGTDTTKQAIESSRKSKGGRSRFMVLSEKDVKILKRDAKVLKILIFKRSSLFVPIISDQEKNLKTLKLEHLEQVLTLKVPWCVFCGVWHVYRELD